jgi:hypothetical protein|tara:strand:- start:4 stop:240 length:237 start_codon:yes stop_codon:yes gene_type:complete
MKKLLAIAYSITMTVIILFPPWSYVVNDNEIFSGFRYLFGNSAALSYQFNIYTTFLSLEILVVSLIFGVLFYVFKDKK